MATSGGTIPDLTTDGYVPSAALGRLVDLRDVTCTFPGSATSSPPHRPRPPPRPTRSAAPTRENLQNLSRRWHRAKHGGWHTRAAPRRHDPLDQPDQRPQLPPPAQAHPPAEDPTRRQPAAAARPARPARRPADPTAAPGVRGCGVLETISGSSVRDQGDDLSDEVRRHAGVRQRLRQGDPHDRAARFPLPRPARTVLDAGRRSLRPHDQVAVEADATAEGGDRQPLVGRVQRRQLLSATGRTA